MQRPDGSVVLMDLGTGRRRNEDHVRYAGTVLFTAPEILDGEAETPRSDLYGLGVLLIGIPFEDWWPRLTTWNGRSGPSARAL